MNVTYWPVSLRGAATIAGILAASVSIAACSDVVTATPTTLPSSSTPLAPPTVVPSSAAAATIGADPGTWTPLQITGKDNGKTISMVPGQVAVLLGLPMNDGEDLNVDVSDENVASFQRGEPTDDAVSAPVIIAKAPGSTDVVFSYDEQGDTSGANVAFKVTISVQDQ